MLSTCAMACWITLSNTVGTTMPSADFCLLNLTIEVDSCPTLSGLRHSPSMAPGNTLPFIPKRTLSSDSRVIHPVPHPRGIGINVYLTPGTRPCITFLFIDSRFCFCLRLGVAIGFIPMGASRGLAPPSVRPCRAYQRV